ncbi:hypothetical protein GCM10027084_02860 [Pseudoxanthomonas sangjuensis]|uniref:hypothetical protein n=1 Tax=Pseudoxanthomonas sangjuensis TaxID=1503750 RepID=UPI001390F143|nr:hypothetical protein [Pseudoxanthomonas sangjuensis]KAF1713834.1 hypothetical protein CSC71_05500 [Pseudoxanthomonas sangjuensis]
MKIRHVFCAPDLAVAQAALRAARRAGVDNRDLLLVARPDIELHSIRNARKEADTDMLPAAMRGIGYGAATGLLAGVAAMLVSTPGISWAGAIAAIVVGAAIGGWIAALVGASVPDPIRRKFSAEIEAGNILVLVDADREHMEAAGFAIVHEGAQLLPFESHKAMA